MVNKTIKEDSFCNLWKTSSLSGKIGCVTFFIAIIMVGCCAVGVFGDGHLFNLSNHTDYSSCVCSR